MQVPQLLHHLLVFPELLHLLLLPFSESGSKMVQQQEMAWPQEMLTQQRHHWS